MLDEPVEAQYGSGKNEGDDDVVGAGGEDGDGGGCCRSRNVVKFPSHFFRPRRLKPSNLQSVWSPATAINYHATQPTVSRSSTAGPDTSQMMVVDVVQR